MCDKNGIDLSDVDAKIANVPQYQTTGTDRPQTHTKKHRKHTARALINRSQRR